MKKTTIQIPDLKHYITNSGKALKSAFAAFKEGFAEEIPVKVKKTSEESGEADKSGKEPRNDDKAAEE